MIDYVQILLSGVLNSCRTCAKIVNHSMKSLAVARMKGKIYDLKNSLEGTTFDIQTPQMNPFYSFRKFDHHL